MPSSLPPSWTRNPTFLHTLRNHEALNTGLDGDLPAHLITPESLLPATLAAKAAELDAREAALDRREHAAQFSSLIRSLQLTCNPTVLGGRDGIAPSPDFDCVLTNAGPHPSVRNLPRQILWIPVPLYPLPLRGKAHPVYGPSHTLGETRVQSSLAFPLLVTSRPDPAHPSQPRLRPVAINAFARVTLSQHSPEEVLTTLDRRDRRHTLELNGPSSDSDGERDSLDAECTSPAFSSSPIPSSAARSINVSSPHPDPATLSSLNPPSSPTAPFDATGNSLRP